MIPRDDVGQDEEKRDDDEDKKEGKIEGLLSVLNPFKKKKNS